MFLDDKLCEIVDTSELLLQVATLQYKKGLTPFPEFVEEVKAVLIDMMNKAIFRM